MQTRASHVVSVCISHDARIMETYLMNLKFDVLGYDGLLPSVSLLLVSVMALLYFVDYVILFSSTMSSGRKTGGWQGIDHRMPEIRGFRLSEEENISISSDFGWMETVGSSIETNESALVWQYRDANSGFGFAHVKEMLDHRVSWKMNMLLSKVSNILLNSNL
ncbi:hypothetical protein Tco_0031282, partial [Tanacetum coccineum]